ncbi:MAG: LSU ribosomal protein L15p (L27Ae), partial [uncultured Solirubrobacteraceae bacterium]
DPVPARALRGRPRGHRAALAQARARQPQGAQARRPRPRLGNRQDVRPRAQGRGRALGLQEPARLRGRPDAAAHADAQAARPAHEEVDALRALPHAHAGRQPAGSRAPLRQGRRGHARGDEGQGPGHPQGRPGEGPRQGRDLQAADRPRAQVQRRRPRGHRGRRRHLSDRRRL